MGLMSGNELQVLNDTGNGLFFCYSVVIIFEHSIFKIYIDD